MYCLLGDTYKKKGNEDAALESYKKAIWTESPDDVLQYALDTATSLLQGRKDWATIASLHGEFLSKYPNSPLAMLSATWVARMKTREGKQAEAATILAESLRSSIANPASDQVEFLIDELVKVSVPRKKAAEIDADALDKQLVETLNKVAKAEGDAEPTPTANARISYARARLAQMLKRPDRYELYLRGVAKNNAEDPSVLSPALLSMCAEILLKDGSLDDAEKMFKRLSDRYKESMFCDAGPVGLGNVALARKEPEAALAIFEDTLTNNPGSFRFKEAVLGKPEALIPHRKNRDANKSNKEIHQCHNSSPFHAKQNYGQIYGKVR